MDTHPVLEPPVAHYTEQRICLVSANYFLHHNFFAYGYNCTAREKKYVCSYGHAKDEALLSARAEAGLETRKWHFATDESKATGAPANWWSPSAARANGWREKRAWWKTSRKGKLLTAAYTKKGRMHQKRELRHNHERARVVRTV